MFFHVYRCLKPNHLLKKWFAAHCKLYEMESEEIKEVFECNICNKDFENVEKFHDHIKSVHVEKPFDDKGEENQRTKPQKCGICDLFPRNLDDHISYVHGKAKKSKCNLCNKVFRDNRTLKTHTINVHKQYQKKYKCNLCDIKFQFESTLQKHNLKIHDSDISHKKFCDFCEKYVCELDRHMSEIHSKEQNFTCHICGNSLSNKQNLRNHVFLVHTDNNKKFQCSTCKKWFSSKNRLKFHHSIVHEGKKVNCKVCGKQFSQNGRLKIHHRNVHQGIKDFSCKYCGKLFSEKQDCINHISRIHEQTEKFICDICNKVYFAIKSLKLHHRNIHEKIFSKPNVINCDKCDKREEITNVIFVMKHFKIAAI